MVRSGVRAPPMSLCNKEKSVMRLWKIAFSTQRHLVSRSTHMYDEEVGIYRYKRSATWKWFMAVWTFHFDWFFDGENECCWCVCMSLSIFGGRTNNGEPHDANAVTCNSKYHSQSTKHNIWACISCVCKAQARVFASEFKLIELRTGFGVMNFPRGNWRRRRRRMDFRCYVACASDTRWSSLSLYSVARNYFGIKFIFDLMRAVAFFISRLEFYYYYS